MSGSDAPPSGGGWGGYVEDQVDCAALRLNRHLQGPVPAVVDTLMKDDILHVRLRCSAAVDDRGDENDDRDDGHSIDLDDSAGADDPDQPPAEQQPETAEPADASIIDAPAPVRAEGITEEVIAVDERERLAGGVLPTTALLDCLRRGAEFVGVVQGVNGGAVQIEIQHVTCRTLRRLVDIEPADGHQFVVDDLFDVLVPADQDAPISLVDESRTVVGTFEADTMLGQCSREGCQYQAVVVKVSDVSVKAVIRVRP
ncbi:hypothetical protein [Mycobacteroides abscessus]